MIIIFDLDYTILDTGRLKRDLADLLKVDLLEFANYQKSGDLFSINAFVDFLLETDKIFDKKNEVEEKIENFLNNFERYLYPGIIEILEKLNSYTLIMLTLGDPEYQNLKIEKLGIGKFFSKIIASDEDKFKKIDFLINTDEKIILVNDKPDELLAMSGKLKNVEMFLVEGPYNDNIDHNIQIKKLDDLVDFVEKNVP